MSVRVDRLLEPVWILGLTVGLSFLAWLIPWGDQVWKGYYVREQLTIVAVVFLFAWYGLALLVSYVGFRLGSRMQPVRLLDQGSDRTFYLVLTALAAVGVVYTYGIVLAPDPAAVSEALTSRTFNSLRYAVPFETGFQTLRYASILAGAMGAHRLAIKREFSVVNVLNIVLLLASSAIASRLSLALAAIVFIALMAGTSRVVQVSLLRILALAAVAFVVLTPLNYIRNANFYERYYGVTNPFVMNAYEMISYVGAPFQVAVGIPNHPRIGDGSGQRIGYAIARYVLPTYLPVRDDAVIAAEDNYRYYVDITENMTTNSALSTMYGAMGEWSFLIMPACLIVAAAVAGHFSRYASSVRLVAPILAYCFAEFWRVYLFTYGVIHFLIFALLGVALAVGLTTRVLYWLGLGDRQPSGLQPSDTTGSSSLVQP